MAKRKRLSPLPVLEPGTTRAPETKALKDGWAGTRAAPIAEVAGASATQAALEEVAGELADARSEGRLVQQIALEAIDEAYLVRDRAVVDADEMAALEASLKARGQQTPIEVVALEGGRYGLISGWRRLMALRGLEGVKAALCLVRPPQSASEAYLAMVEENEIRASLSYYERARIAARAAEQGAFPTARLAVKGLFANVSSSKRSKIASFLAVYDALDEVLQFPAALTERQGLALAKALEADAGLGARIAVALEEVSPADVGAEQAVLAKLSIPAKPEATAPPAVKDPVRKDPALAQDGIRVETRQGQVSLTGAGVTDAFVQALQDWLAAYEAPSG